jgi:hypothetical protein
MGRPGTARPMPLVASHGALTRPPSPTAMVVSGLVGKGLRSLATHWLQIHTVAMAEVLDR